MEDFRRRGLTGSLLGLNWVLTLLDARAMDLSEEAARNNSTLVIVTRGSLIITFSMTLIVGLI